MKNIVIAGFSEVKDLNLDLNPLSLKLDAKTKIPEVYFNSGYFIPKIFLFGFIKIYGIGNVHLNIDNFSLDYKSKISIKGFHEPIQIKNSKIDLDLKINVRKLHQTKTFFA